MIGLYKTDEVSLKKSNDNDMKQINNDYYLAFCGTSLLKFLMDVVILILPRVIVSLTKVPFG